MLPIRTLAVLGLSCLPLLAVQSDLGASSAAASAPAALPPLTNTELPTYTKELLVLAFHSASALPIEPHIKNRSRAQELVIEASIELGQLRSAREFASEIDNWRRGASLADLAFACAKAGDVERVAELIERAAESIAETDDDMAQGWRRDRLRTKIARALLAAGDADGAALWSTGAVDGEIARVAAEAARTMSFEQARSYHTVIDRAVKATLFEQVMGALEIGADLHRLHYADEELRNSLEAKIKASWELMPIGVRITLLADLAQGASEAGDGPNAVRLLDEARALMDGYPWGQMRFHLPLIARLAQGRAAAGDGPGAQAALAYGRTVFAVGQAATPDVFQARALRPLAEAAALAGETELAAALFAETLTVGLHNPNARPRAEDLSATACAMARVGFEPSPELWGRMRAALANLAAPW